MYRCFEDRFLWNTVGCVQITNLSSSSLTAPLSRQLEVFAQKDAFKAEKNSCGIFLGGVVVVDDDGGGCLFLIFDFCMDGTTILLGEAYQNDNDMNVDRSGNVVADMKSLTPFSKHLLQLWKHMKRKH